MELVRRAGAATADGRAALRRALGPVSTVGRVVLVAAVVLGAAGTRLGWVELTVVAAALAAVLAVAALLTVGRSAYDVRLELSDHRVTVGERAVGRVLVRSTARRRMLPAAVELPVGRGSAWLRVPSLGPGDSHEEVFAVPTTRRAVVVVGPVLSVRGDPLGLVRRQVVWTDPVDLHVHPRVVPLGGASAGVLRDLEGQATRALSDADLSFHALRDYVPGDDRRHVHWRSTARTGTLVVRQMEDTRRTRTAVALATAAGDYADADEVELAVTVAASVGVAAVRDGRAVTVLAGERSPRTPTPALRSATAALLLDDVAALAVTEDGHRGTELARWVARSAPDASVAVLVTGSGPHPGDLRASTVHGPAGVRTVVLRCRPGAEAQVRTHGGLSVATVGAPADLPGVLRRAVTG